MTLTTETELDRILADIDRAVEEADRLGITGHQLANEMRRIGHGMAALARLLAQFETRVAQLEWALKFQNGDPNYLVEHRKRTRQQG